MKVFLKGSISMRVVVWLLVLVTISTAQKPANDPYYQACHHVIGLTGDVPPGTNTVRLCEKDSTGYGIYTVLYDWKLRIPLVTQTHLNHTQIKASNPGRYTGSFGTSGLIGHQYQARTDDYESLNSRTPKYETLAETLQLDTKWSEITSAKTPVHRGHMVADQYIKHTQWKFTTYRFTNVVPQFRSSNCGPWCNMETALIKQWSKMYCTHTSGTGNKWDMYIATGTVPSMGTSQRWFGRYGFGSEEDQACSINYDGKRFLAPNTEWPYRINVPTSMWTAACCIERDPKDNIVSYKNTAFSVGNVPHTSGTVVKAVAPTLPGNPQPFPSIVECVQPKYYTRVKDMAFLTATGLRTTSNFWIVAYLLILIPTLLL